MIETASGLQFEDLVEGIGASPTSGQTCVIHYTCWLWIDDAKGGKYGSSHDAGGPVEFPLWRGWVSNGWEEGVATMKPGGKRRLLLPPHLAYRGGATSGGTFLVEIELLRVVDHRADRRRAVLDKLPAGLAAHLEDLCRTSGASFPEQGLDVVAVVIDDDIHCEPPARPSESQERLRQFFCCCVLGDTTCQTAFSAEGIVDDFLDAIRQAFPDSTLHTEVTESRGWFNGLSLWITTPGKRIFIDLSWDVS